MRDLGICDIRISLGSSLLVILSVLAIGLVPALLVARHVRQKYGQRVFLSWNGVPAILGGMLIAVGIGVASQPDTAVSTEPQVSRPTGSTAPPATISAPVGSSLPATGGVSPPFSGEVHSPTDGQNQAGVERETEGGMLSPPGETNVETPISDQVKLPPPVAPAPRYDGNSSEARAKIEAERAAAENELIRQAEIEQLRAENARLQAENDRQQQAKTEAEERKRLAAEAEQKRRDEAERKAEQDRKHQQTIQTIDALGRVIRPQ